MDVIDTEQTRVAIRSAEIYVGGNATVGGPNAVRKNSTYGGQIFGAGRGNTNQAASMDYSYVVIADNAQILRKESEATGNVYGGGNIGYTYKESNIYILGGTVEGSVYGGAYSNALNIPYTNITMKGGLVKGGVYGGSNSSGTISNDVTMHIDGGQVGVDADHPANIHGGGLGSPTRVNGNVEVTLGTRTDNSDGTYTCSGDAVIYGDVYGGSALGYVNGTAAADTYHTYVTLNKGTIHGSLYGGGLGDGSTAANVYGPVQVKVYGGSVKKTDSNGANGSGGVYGANNVKGAPQRSVTVDIYGTDPAPAANEYALYAVYGGGNQADYTYGSGYPKVTVHNCNNSIEYVYGGGNLAAYEPANANATGQFTSMTLNDNTTFTHDATNNPLQVVIYGCSDVSIEYVYGGGNAASTPSTDVVILGCREINYVFGGGNGKDMVFKNGAWEDNTGAHVGYKNNGTTSYGTGKASTSLLGGTIHHAFGGSNTLGNVRDSAVALLDEASDCDLSIDDVYGGGNEAYMEGDSQIALGCITYLKEIYGGAKMADVGGDIVLTITSGRFDRVFGGNNMSGEIEGTIIVNIEETGCHPIIIGELYGGGNEAHYTAPFKSGSTTERENGPTINIKSFTSIGRVFGGGLGKTAYVTGNTTVNINEVVGANASVSSTYPGTTLTLPDNTTVDLPDHTSGAIGSIGVVFGGGNAAEVRGNTAVNIGTLSTITYESGSDHTAKNVVGASITGNVYGGGNQANVTGKTDVIIGRGQ